MPFFNRANRWKFLYIDSKCTLKKKKKLYIGPFSVLRSLEEQVKSLCYKIDFPCNFNRIWLDFQIFHRRSCLYFNTILFSSKFSLFKRPSFCFTVLYDFLLGLSHQRQCLGNLLMPFCLGSIYHSYKYDKVKWDLPPYPTLKKVTIKMSVVGTLYWELPELGAKERK